MARRGAARLAAELTGSVSPGSRPRAWVEPGVVKAVAAGYVGDAGSDATMTVTWRGVDVPCSFLASYSPVAGDVVLLLVQPPSLICLDRLVGPNVESDD